MKKENYTYLHFLDQVFSYLNKLKYWILLSISLGVISGYMLHKTTRTVYTAKLVAYSNNLTSERIQEIFEDYNEMIAQKEYNKLALNLNLTYEEVQKILKFKTTLTDRLIVDAVSEGKNSLYLFAIEVESYDVNLYKRLEENLPEIIEDISFVKRKQQIFNKSLENNISVIETEINYLRDLKDILLVSIKNGNNSNPNAITDLGNISREIVSFEEKVQYAKNQIDLNKKDIIILKGFNLSIKILRPKFMRNIASGILISLALFSLIFFIIEYRKYRVNLK